MKFVYITSEDAKKISKLINEFARKIIKDYQVECIYVTKFLKTAKQPIIDITIVFNEFDSCIASDIEKLKEFQNTIKGINIRIICAPSYFYDFNDNIEVENTPIRDLLNSQIIFDRYGYYSDLQDYYFNKVAAEIYQYPNNFNFLNTFKLKRYKK
jgi:hypothetical protein